ncbi:amidohydrolase family protein [Bosea sp. Root381]|uniref:amidohydrolase family protein n=1 Tax=Bosea sp. Root381 TaxID=1736524 RepID=UPI0009EBF44D|nr:amidohydrolase family protein [Bosea sp. Root381]
MTDARPIAGKLPQERPGAELIVFNANIFTGNLAQPEASALAVTKGRIYAVGSDAEILDLKNSGTRIIDAGGRRLIPGIIDAHIHLLNESNFTFTVRWDGVPTLRRALSMLAEQGDRTPEGQWVKVIGGWTPYQFEENRFPTMDELREAVPDRPLMVQYAYNRAFMNDLAMEAIGAGTDRFPDFKVIEFETDERGDLPSGSRHSSEMTGSAPFKRAISALAALSSLSCLPGSGRSRHRLGATFDRWMVTHGPSITLLKTPVTGPLKRSARRNLVSSTDPVEA